MFECSSGPCDTFIHRARFSKLELTQEQAGDQQQEDQALSEKAHMAYMADYIVHRITMPDGNGNLLQPDVTRPEEEVGAPRAMYSPW